MAAPQWLWEDILAALKWLWEQREWLGREFSTISGGVTNVRRWHNDTDVELEVWKFDHDDPKTKKDWVKIPPRQTRDFGMWIPWADSEAKYNAGRRAFIQVGGKVIANIWQSGPLVRFNVEDKWVAGGEPIPGSATSGGERKLVVTKDPQGRAAFMVGPYSQTFTPTDDADYQRLEEEWEEDQRAAQMRPEDRLE
jgi:hypothetical protein